MTPARLSPSRVEEIRRIQLPAGSTTRLALDDLLAAGDAGEPR